MSLLKKIGKFAKRAVRKVAPLASMIPGPIGAAAGVLGAVTAKRPPISEFGSMSILPALPSLPAAVGGAVRALPRILPGAGRAAGSVMQGVRRAVGSQAARRVGRAVGVAATGVAIYDAAGNLLGYRKKRRSINPMNWRALNRALKRVEKAKKAAKRINAVSIRKEKC